MNAKVERIAIGVLCLAIGCFYAWTVRSSGEPWDFGEEKSDYFNLLIDGYLDGQLHMKVEVPDALLQIVNPYDPKERPAGLGLHDASFYQGRYYVYFGAAPMIVLMLPFRLLSGMDLPLPVAILVFVYAGFLISVRLLLSVRRRYFPETGTLTVLLGVAVLGLAGVAAVLLRRPDMWELPVAGGFCFAMLALAGVWCSLHGESRRGPWFTAAAVSLGLAIASRPTYLFACPLLAPPLLWWWRSEPRPPWRMAVRAGVSLAIIGGLMAWHNFARFDNALEFGQAYQFSLDYESKLPHFRAAYVPFTARAYFFSSADWSAYFPFIRRPDLGAPPAGFTLHRGDVHGILFNYPIAWLAFLSPLALWRRPSFDRGPLGAWLASVACLFVCTAGLLLFFFSALARYQMDFMPAFMLLSCVGLLAVARWLTHVQLRLCRVLVRTGWMTAAGVSVIFGVLFSLQYEGLLSAQRPVLEKALARSLNEIPAFLERLAGVRHGAIELALQLPAESKPGLETLLTTGEPPAVDRVIVQDNGSGQVQFGIAAHGAPTQLTRPLTLERSAIHRLRISMGSLYPPSVHPVFSERSPDEIRTIVRQLRIEVNDEPVLVGHHRAHVTDRRSVRVGDDATADAVYPRFRGTVRHMRRLGASYFAMSGSEGPFVRLRLSINPGSDGGCEPLIAFGESGAHGLLTITRSAGTHVKFGFLGEGGGVIGSGLIGFEPDRTHEVVVRFEPGTTPDRKRMLVWCDARLVWAPEVGWRGEMRQVVIGKNPAGAKCEPEFRGVISSSQHDAEGRDPIEASGGMHLRLRLPSDPTGQAEPLVVTGRSGAGDLLVIRLVDAGTVRFGFDHWGTPMEWSEAVGVDFAQPLALEIAMASLHTVEDANAVRGMLRGLLRVNVNGRTVWQLTREFYAAEPQEVALGRNTIGGTSAGPDFSGDILSAERVPRE